MRDYSVGTTQTSTLKHAILGSFGSLCGQRNARAWNPAVSVTEMKVECKACRKVLLRRAEGDLARAAGILAFYDERNGDV
jgi:hypothetical protein